MPNYKSISVVIVSWNVKDLVDNCIFSILENGFNGPLEIIVIDNASSDGTVEHLNDKYQGRVRLIANKENVGFARANNQGFQLAVYEVVFILNPDTVVREGALTLLLEALNKDETIGMLSPKLELPNGEIDKACARVFPSIRNYFCTELLPMHKFYYLGNFFRKRFLMPYDFDKSQRVQAISGAAMFISKSLLTKVGGFYHGYHHGGEDLELCHSVIQMGLNNFYYPTPVVIHFDKGSTKRAKVRVTINAHISMCLFFERTRGGFYAFLYKWMIRVMVAPSLYLYGLLRFQLRKLNKSQLEERRQLALGLLKWKLIKHD